MFFKVVYAIVWPIVHFLFPFKIIGKEKLRNQKQGYVLCANHISLLDPVYLIYALTRKNRIRIMAKGELFKNKLFGWFFFKVGAFPVNRGVGAEALKTATKVLEDGEALMVFPEGTRSKDGKLGRGKMGAAMLVNAVGTYVLPVSIITKNQKVRIFRKTTLVVGDPIYMPPQGDATQREHLKECTGIIMNSIEKGLKVCEE